jgi:hypothetical protein
VDRLLPNQVFNRTRATRREDAAIRRPYKGKDQCAQIALAFDNVVGAGFALDRIEGEGEIQPPELRLHGAYFAVKK